MSYAERQLARIAEIGSNLCVGLDPRPEPGLDIATWLRQVMEETAPYAAAYKPNMAYFEAMGAKGVALLENLLAERPTGIPLILDAKRGDIGETQRYYAKAYFDGWNVDAVTLSPYMGYDSIEPFLGYPGKGVFLLGVTSNPGSQDLQLQKIAEEYVFEKVQEMALRAPLGSAGLVMGLTNAASWILERVADLPLLVPGLGAQGGDLNALASQGRKAPILVNVSRGILYGNDTLSFAERAREFSRQIAQALAPT